MKRSVLMIIALSLSMHSAESMMMTGTGVLTWSGYVSWTELVGLKDKVMGLEGQLISLENQIQQMQLMTLLLAASFVLYVEWHHIRSIKRSIGNYFMRNQEALPVLEPVIILKTEE